MLSVFISRVCCCVFISAVVFAREREALLLDYIVKYHELKARWKTMLVLSSLPGRECVCVCMHAYECLCVCVSVHVNVVCVCACAHV